MVDLRSGMLTINFYLHFNNEDLKCLYNDYFRESEVLDLDYF